MKLNDYKKILIAAGLIGILLIATPALVNAIHLPGGQQFSELYLLGSNQKASNYPFDIAVGENYSVYAGAANQMGSPQYYVLYVKLLNQTDLLPNEITGTPSPIQPLYEYRFSIANGQTWNSLLAFSISKGYVLNKQSTIENLNINGVNFNIEKAAAWNSTQSEFPYRLLIELWLLNPQSGLLQFNNRFVDLQLNYTQTQ